MRKLIIWLNFFDNEGCGVRWLFSGGDVVGKRFVYKVYWLFLGLKY